MRKLISKLIPKKVVGLFIARETIDLVVMAQTIKGAKIVKFAQRDIFPKEEPDNTIKPETKPKAREEAVLEAINKALSQNNIRTKEVVTALPSEEVMVRHFQMPKIPKQERDSAISFEAKRYIPFRIEDVVYDFQVLESSVTPNQMDVVFVAVKKEVLNKLVSLFQKAGLKPSVIEPAAFSLMRVLKDSEQIYPNEIVAIVDIDPGIANIIILRYGVPYLIRDISLEISKISKNEPLEPVFEKLLAEIRLSFDFYEKQFPAESIKKLIIYSRVPLENWGELVHRELQIPVHVGDPKSGIKTKRGTISPGVVIGLGLAMRGISEPFIDVNLFKEKKEFFKKKESFLKLALAEASLAIFILIILRVVMFRTLIPLLNELDRLNKERPTVEIKIASSSLSELERFKNEFENKKSLFKKVIEGRSFLTPRLGELPGIISENTWLSEFVFEEEAKKGEPFKSQKVLNLKGFILADPNISDMELANKVLINLQTSGVFSEGLVKSEIISVKRIELNGRKVVSFEMSFSGV